jgi:hypothetical protein
VQRAIDHVDGAVGVVDLPGAAVLEMSTSGTGRSRHLDLAIGGHARQARVQQRRDAAQDGVATAVVIDPADLARPTQTGHDEGGVGNAPLALVLGLEGPGERNKTEDASMQGCAIVTIVGADGAAEEPSAFAGRSPTARGGHEYEGRCLVKPAFELAPGTFSGAL